MIQHIRDFSSDWSSSIPNFDEGKIEVCKRIIITRISLVSEYFGLTVSTSKQACYTQPSTGVVTSIFMTYFSIGDDHWEGVRFNQFHKKYSTSYEFGLDLRLERWQSEIVKLRTSNSWDSKHEKTMLNVL